MVITRQNYLQNFLSVLGLMLIVLYYTFNGIPEEGFKAESYSSAKVAEYENSVELEKSVSHLRAAILMDADVVQVNGLLYQLELALATLTTEQEASAQAKSIYNLLAVNNKKGAIRKINSLRTILVQKTKTLR
ncbi:hypothetical protein [Emticicia sp. TH156]|uniref:hypothetical protein n=1 Tax=Emticicia sp. TH156 TaxID=2067454 RepID=UPI000C75942F|nr:hypothetical protein [Emticicia sp. TH156]PLK43272.1 hypothetical protein C0V77_15240 [Emticicia sp. TH156]